MRSRNDKGTISEFLGLIFFLVVVLGILIPFVVELLAYTGQAQEVDRITKIAAKRACSLLANPTVGIASDLKQSSLGVGTDVSVMQPLVNQVFMNETSQPRSYFENTSDQRNIDLQLFDYLGQEINIRGNNDNWVDIEDDQGRKGRVLLLGTNTESALCPSGGAANGDWKYCMSAQNDQAVKQALSNTGQGQNQDLIQRMQKLQAGRCGPGDNREACRNSFRNRLDRCTVCAIKTRQSIFRKTLFGPFLACETARTQNRVFPCGIAACATERLTQLSTKRGYNPAYQDNKTLGEKFSSVELNPKSVVAGKNAILNEKTEIPDQQKADDGTIQFYQNMDNQFKTGAPN